MGSIRQRCLPLFSFIRFIAWLVPWPWVGDSGACSQVSRKTSTYVESPALCAKIDEFLSVSNNDLEYLTREEAEQIIDRFNNVPQSSDRLLFWTGVPRERAQQWADNHGMLTLTSAMGPLMDSTDQRCLRRDKKLKGWSKYVKGASGIFARYACRRGIVRVLTLPPSWAEFIRPESTYRTIEEPVLKGTSGCRCALQINTVHLLATPGEVEYQIWPINRIPERLRCRGADGLNFRLPRWARKAVETATKSLRSNVVSFTASSTPKSAAASLVFQGSIQKAEEPQTAEQSKGCKQLASHTSTEVSLQPQSQQSQSKKQQPQCQQPQSKKKQKPQSQQSQKQQSQSRQPQSKSRQSQSQPPQSQQPQSKKKLPQNKKQQPQTQPSQCQQPQSKKQQSKKQQPQIQQSQSKKQQLQTQQSQRQQPQSQQPRGKKQQPQNHQSQGKKMLLQSNQQSLIKV